MTGWPFRFVHASDFHLELPLFGVSEVPAHLRELFLEAPYAAARRVFDTVLTEEAEFLVLAGDLLSSFDAGPRGVLFLLAQFERLAQRRVPVYWATGRVDATDGWPSSAVLPPNVHLFPRGRAVEKIYERDGQRLARLVGLSRHERGKIRGADYFVEPDGVFSIAVAHGEADPDSLASQGIDYWALGGEHQRRTLLGGPHVVAYCGSPQGREPTETGPHGCLLVHADDRRAVRTTLIETDAVRWSHERLTLNDAARRPDIEEQMRNRLAQIRAAAPQTTVLVSWTVLAGGPLLTALRHGAVATELLQSLRADFGHGEQPVWSVELTSEPATELPVAWHDEDTILGEFLRRVRYLENTTEAPLELSKLLGERHAAGSVASLIELGDSTVRTRVLHRAALLGADLLRGDESATSAQ